MSPTTGIIVGISILAGRFIYHFLKERNADISSSKFEAYTMNSQHLKDIKALLEQKKYNLVELEISNLSADKLSQLADYIGLFFQETDFEDWLNNSTNSNIPHLFLGVHYDFLGWQARSHQRASEVSHNQAVSFHEYQNKARRQYNKVDENSPFMTEVHSRLIRIYKSLGQRQLAMSHFQHAIAANPNHLAAYANCSEMVQPKWGGSYDSINNLLNDLPDNQLIKQVIRLKLTWDALIMEDNYFGGKVEELPKLAHETIKRIDQELSTQPPQSIQKFIAYIYMFYIAGELNNKKLEQKYYNQMNGAFSIYSHGVA